MKQINNGFMDYYYLTDEGKVYNSNSKVYLKISDGYKYKLKTLDNKFKTITLKKLYKLVFDKVFCIDDIEDLKDEEWKIIDNTNSLYLISSLGRIKSYQSYKAILLKPFDNKRGYLRVDIIEEGQRQTKLLHRLVAAAFLPMPESINYQLHHIDGNKYNNAAANLKWLTPAAHRIEHKKLKENANNVCA